MRRILAISALHLATLNPNVRQDLTAKAVKHECEGFPSFRASVAKLDEQNCHAIFAFLGLVVSYS